MPDAVRMPSTGGGKPPPQPRDPQQIIIDMLNQHGEMFVALAADIAELRRDLDQRFGQLDAKVDRLIELAEGGGHAG